MLNPKQYRKLKSIQMLNGTKAKDYDKNKDLYIFFLQQGFVKRKEVGGYEGYIITPKGDSAIYSYKVEHYRFWVPTLISFIALVVSIASFITKNEELLKSLKELLQIWKIFPPS